MKIKQQKQIKAFLVEEFGTDQGNALFNKQENTHLRRKWSWCRDFTQFTAKYFLRSCAQPTCRKVSRLVAGIIMMSR